MRPPRGPRPLAIPLTDRQRAILEDIVHSRRRPHDEVQRATIILQSADGARTRHLAEALRVSRTPVHEAVGRLVKDGLLVQEPPRKIIVARFTREDAVEIYEMRQLLESSAARRAARA